MLRIDHLFLINLLALFAFASPANAQDADDADDCSGCSFLLNGPNGGGNGQPNPCGTDQRVTIMGFNGACKLDREREDCVQESPCFAGIQAEYRSNCAVNMSWVNGPLGAPGLDFPAPPTPGGAWVAFPPVLETLNCDSPMYVLLFEISDATGFHSFSSAQYRCTPCE